MTNWRAFPVHAVTSDSLVESPGFFDLAAQVASSGLAAINLRAHGLTGRKLYDTAVRLRKITASHGAPLIVAGRLDIALAVGADAAQLGANTVPPEQVAGLCRQRGTEFGCSCHSKAEALAARDAGASYIYLGTIFSSASKPDSLPCGTGLLAKIVKLIDIPVVAIGGIDGGNIREVNAAGASAAAAITAVWTAPSPGGAVKDMAAGFDGN